MSRSRQALVVVAFVANESCSCAQRGRVAAASLFPRSLRAPFVGGRSIEEKF